MDVLVRLLGDLIPQGFATAHHAIIHLADLLSFRAGLSWLVDPCRIPFLMPFGKRKPNPQDEKIHCTPASHVSSLES